MTFTALKRCLLLLTVCLLCACGGKAEPFSLTDITGADFAREFRLTDHNGKPVTLSTYGGKAVWLFFGFTNCPDVCPTTMSQLAQAYKKMGAEADRVQVLFVSLDPERDSVDILRQYVPAFHPSFVGLSGSPEQIAATAKEFKVFFQKQASEDPKFYSLDHSSSVFVFDPDGRPRLFFTAANKTDELVRDTQRLLAER